MGSIEMLQVGFWDAKNRKPGRDKSSEFETRMGIRRKKNMVLNKADKSRRILLVLAEMLLWKTCVGDLVWVAAPGARL